jgi:hypothetical protein
MGLKDWSVFKQLRSNSVSEGDEALTDGKKRFRDIVGSDSLVHIVKNNIWLFVLITVLTVAYVAVGYQCQQDEITIGKLEKALEDARLRVLSSQSDLTRLSRQSNLMEKLEEDGNTELHTGLYPYIINVPEEN